MTNPLDFSLSGRDPREGRQISKVKPGTIVLGFFEILEEIGVGSYATVYLAQQTGTERKAVVKIAHPHLASGPFQEMTRARFATEFRAATRVDHPSLATVYVAGETEEGAPAIAMEYIPGKTLNAMLRGERTIDPLAILEMIGQLAASLEVLHQAGIIHRDLSPNNVMVQRRPRDGRIMMRVLDFGVAKIDELSNHTRGPVGTPRYMAPEQIYGEPCLNSDVFGLGAIAWWALTGKEYPPGTRTLGELMRFHTTHSEGLQPREFNPAIPIWLANLVQDMLHPHAHFRPTASDVRGRVQRLVKMIAHAREHDHTQTLDSGSLPIPTPPESREEVVGGTSIDARLQQHADA